MMLNEVLKFVKNGICGDVKSYKKQEMKDLVAVSYKCSVKRACIFHLILVGMLSIVKLSVILIIDKKFFKSCSLIFTQNFNFYVRASDTCGCRQLSLVLSNSKLDAVGGREEVVARKSMKKFTAMIFYIAIKTTFRNYFHKININLKLY